MGQQPRSRGVEDPSPPVCGICGSIAFDGGEPLAATDLEAMLATLVHRGPDAAGRVLIGPAALGVRRLAIIDVAGGQQPLASEDGAVQAVCNGEIYNYRALRTELVERGHHFTTGSDCEVIVHAYEEYGYPEFLTRLNGMFALAVWDDRRGRGVLARDRVGIKPLYYAQYLQRLVFASEPRAL